MAKLANISDFLSDNILGRDFKGKYRRRFTEKETKDKSLPEIWKEAGINFYTAPKS